MKKTVLRNILSFILVFTFVIGLLPINAFAKTAENSFIATMSGLKVCGTINDLKPVSTYPKEYDVEITQCVEVGSNRKFGPNDTFSRDREYRIRFRFKMKGNYEVNTKSNWCYVNGTIGTKFSYNYEEISFDVTLPVDEITGTITTLTTRNPKYGYTVNKFGSEIYYDDNANNSRHYKRELVSVSEYNDKDTPLSGDYLLQGGHIYYVKVKWNPKPGYVFASYSDMSYDYDIRRNGYTPAWTEKEITVTYQAYVPNPMEVNNIDLTLRVEKGKEKDKAYRKNLHAADCSEKDNITSYTSDCESRYRFYFHVLLDKTDGRSLGPDDEIKPGHIFDLSYKFYAQPGYSFAEAGLFNVTINGKKAIIGNYYSSTKVMMIAEDLTYDDIVKVHCINDEIKMPVAGKTFADFSNETLNDEFILSYQSVRDIDDNNRLLAKNEKFVAWRYYRIYFNIIGAGSKNYIKFAPAPSVILNGHKAFYTNGAPQFHIDLRAYPDHIDDFNVVVEEAKDGEYIRDFIKNIRLNSSGDKDTLKIADIELENRTTERKLGSCDRFQGGYDYRMILAIKPRTGYPLSEDESILKGVKCRMSYGDSFYVIKPGVSDGIYLNYIFDFKCDDPSMLEWTHVDIENFEFGNKGSDIKITVPDDQHYYLESFTITDTGNADMTDEYFEWEEPYWLTFTFRPEKGYHFSHARTRLNYVCGEDDTTTWKDNLKDTSVFSMRLTLECLPGKINGTQVFIDPPAPGFTPNDINVSVPAGKGYCIGTSEGSVIWYHDNMPKGKMADDEKFIPGEHYKCWVDLYIKDEYENQYEFVDGENIKGYINGNDAHIGNAYPQGVSLWYEFVCPEKVDKIELTLDGFEDGSSSIYLHLPEDAVYECYDAGMYCANGYLYEGESPIAAGEKYIFALYFQIKTPMTDLYSFNMGDIVVTVNGETLTDNYWESSPYKGYLQITLTVPEKSKPEEPQALGDINGDGKVNTADYTMLKRAVLGTYTLNGDQKKAGDINGDGKITAVDYTMLKRFVLGTLGL